MGMSAPAQVTLARSLTQSTSFSPDSGRYRPEMPLAGAAHSIGGNDERHRLVNQGPVDKTTKRAQTPHGR
jgi:hypothetical protein